MAKRNSDIARPMVLRCPRIDVVARSHEERDIFDMRDKKISKLSLTLFLFIGIYAASYLTFSRLIVRYQEGESVVIRDRQGDIIEIRPNSRGYYARYVSRIPERFEKLLLKKEDRFFYFHPGINPVSIAKTAFSYLSGGSRRGLSAITQQTVKMILGNENQRTSANKIAEVFGAFSLELFATKKEILMMYANSVYFGNQIQGLAEASRHYFDADPELLTDQEIVSLLATLNNPSYRYPGTPANKKATSRLAASLINAHFLETKSILGSSASKSVFTRNEPTAFELRGLKTPCHTSCTLTIDHTLTETLRSLLKERLSLEAFETVQNGAIAVIKLPENELLALVGSPEPIRTSGGAKINMAIKPRAIGSTIKPFIYMKAFENGARPYTLVTDREYKYDIGTGFAFYPKNYDGTYRGRVTLHEALSNSLNVPSVKVLEYVGLPEFYQFLESTLGFRSYQPMPTYELGIALGALEMDLLTLSHYFTIFPNGGMLKPLRVFRDTKSNESIASPMGPHLAGPQEITKKEFTELINKILADRDTGINQFGLKSNLNLPFANYALKTGTSRNFRDSWTIGYTPDFLVGVWIGNHDTTPMRELSGQTGAGTIWQKTMEALYASAYNRNTPFSFASLREFYHDDTLEYGLADDDYDAMRLAMERNIIIEHPHNGDTFLFDTKSAIPLSSPQSVDWFINNSFIGRGTETIWKPERAALYTIRAQTPDGKHEESRVRVVEEIE